jgi:hypothetical protein
MNCFESYPNLECTYLLVAAIAVDAHCYVASCIGVLFAGMRAEALAAAAACGPPQCRQELLLTYVSRCGRCAA